MSVKWRFQRIESEIFSSIGPLGEKLNFSFPLDFHWFRNYDNFLSYSKSTFQDPFNGI